MGKTKEEKKIEKLKESILLNFKNMRICKEKLSTESNEKKILKLNNRIESYHRLIKRSMSDYVGLGGDVNNIISNLDEEDKLLLNKLFPCGNSFDSIKMREIVDKIIFRMDKVKKLKQKMTFDPNDDIKVKVKNDLFRAYEFIGTYIMALEDKSLRSFYNEYWQYTRDYENTKDKYFTKEEQEIIATGLECSREYNEYFKEKHKFALGILDKIEETGEKLIEVGEKIGDFGELTQAKVWVDNYYKDVFPQIVKNIEGDIKGEELEEKSKAMTRRYIEFILSKEETSKAMEEKLYYERKGAEIVEELKDDSQKAKENLKGLLGNISSIMIDKMVREMEKEPYIAIYDMVKANEGEERAAFMFLYDREPIIESKIETFSKYSFEELGL
ncbi:hypothetical protein [Anaerofustis sp. NSJ-163]|uniref:hypothetical protein n=1 Tax=Anaerofustis sp. NSJ-163 TaxID=2944391 RepID=UPI00209C0B1F|nr:hypothetical protein [Anaerofustis sp. NSJ-163]MCO8193208.1 hypothetical protein [Anaerofustis sp. NSJ-163]